MRIALLGGGHLGAPLGKAWTKSGHDVFFGVRDPAAAGMTEMLGACAGRARAGTPAQALAFAGVVVVALPWPAVDQVLGSLDVAGKIVIDCTNPPAGLAARTTTTAGKTILRRERGASGCGEDKFGGCSR